MYKNIVPLLFATDSTYIFPTAVVINSILKNADNTTFYDIYIFLDQKNIETCKSLLAKLENIYENFKITYLKIDTQLFQNVKTTNPHVTNPAYFRLLAAELLPQYDRCICLDSDILVKQDLTELYNVEMKDNYIAGVKSWDDQQPTEENRKHMLSDGLPSMDQYLYTGVLVMNLKQMRHENVTAKFMQHINKRYRSDDQDVFNICCYDRITFLPAKYNLLIRFYHIKLLEGKQIYSKQELEEAWTKPVILHFPGRRIKPWVNGRVKEADGWWKYAEIYRDSKQYQYYREMQKTWVQEMGWSGLMKKIDNHKKLVLFGFSDTGREVFYSLKRGGIYRVIGFCDNDSQKQGQFFEEVPIWSPSHLLKLDEEFVVIITSQFYFSEIKKQLIGLGLAPENIVVYTRKNPFYYRAISDKYFKEELEDIYYKEYGTPVMFTSDEYEELIRKLKMSTEEEVRHLISKYSLNEWLLC